MKTAYQIQAVAKHPQLLEAVWTELLDEWMSGKNRAVRRRRTVREMLLLEEKLGRSSLASNPRARSGHSFWQVCFWSWKTLGPLSNGSARTRDQSDLRKRHIHFGRRNTTAEKAATRTLPPCRLSAGVAFTPALCDWGNHFSHTKIVPKKAAFVRPTEHLKIVGQLQCWAKGCPLSPPKLE